MTVEARKIIPNYTPPPKKSLEEKIAECQKHQKELWFRFDRGDYKGSLESNQQLFFWGTELINAYYGLNGPGNFRPEDFDDEQKEIIRGFHDTQIKYEDRLSAVEPEDLTPPDEMYIPDEWREEADFDELVLFLDKRIKDYNDGVGKYGGWTKPEYDAVKAEREEERNNEIRKCYAGELPDYDNWEEYWMRINKASRLTNTPIKMPEDKYAEVEEWKDGDEFIGIKPENYAARAAEAKGWTEDDKRDMWQRLRPVRRKKEVKPRDFTPIFIPSPKNMNPPPVGFWRDPETGEPIDHPPHLTKEEYAEVQKDPYWLKRRGEELMKAAGMEVPSS